jgi:hypothetical protein
MGETYCNDPRCQRNRNGERHKAHITGEKLASHYVGENYCNDPGARETGMERNMKHTLRESFRKKRLLKSSLILLKETHTVMTQGARQTGTERYIDRILHTIQILIILNIWVDTKHIRVLPLLECTFTKTE